MPDHIEFIDEPLLTEDGLVNPVCIAKLEAAIENMPNISERTAGEPEWETPHWLSWRQILGALAHWAVRQIAPEDDTAMPPHFVEVLGFFAACTRPKFDKHGLAQMSLRDVAAMLYDVLMPEPLFLAWNDCEQLKGWMDLDALITNVCVSIRNELRANAEFEREFEAQYGPLDE